VGRPGTSREWPQKTQKDTKKREEAGGREQAFFAPFGDMPLSYLLPPFLWTLVFFVAILFLLPLAVAVV
jgi:hypothetical protein